MPILSRRLSRCLPVLAPFVPLALAPLVGADVFTNVPEAAGFRLDYQISIPASAAYGSAAPVYSADNSGSIATGSFTRVGYYLELSGSTNANDNNGYVYVSFDASSAGFTTNAARLGVPTAASAENYQINVTNMNVVSNVTGIVTGTGLSGGNLEFWPLNYLQGRFQGYSNASDSTYDFDDTQNSGGNYGSLQIHNHTAGQTLLAWNNWNGGGPGDLGIGNSPAAAGSNPDWTFRNNAGDYSVRTMQVVVNPEPGSLGLLAVAGLAVLARRRRAGA